MPKAKDVKGALEKLAEEVKLFRGLRGPVVGSGNEMKPRPGYAVFASSDPHVASSYANPLSHLEIENWDSPHAVFPFRARPTKIIEFPTKPTEHGGNTFDKFAFDRMATQLKPGEALVARNVYDAGPRANVTADPEKRYSYPSDVWAVGPDVETTPLHKAKGGKVGEFDKALQYVRNKLPQTGFFSTLDELIANAPFEGAPADQWKSYLQPGRVFEREGVKFPLKKEEIDYSGLDYTLGGPLNSSFTKDDLRRLVRQKRPEFALRVGVEHPTTGPSLFPEETKLHEQIKRSFANSPTNAEGIVQWDFNKVRRPPEFKKALYPHYSVQHEPGTYEESATRSTDFGPGEGQHFGPDVISHSRTTLQPTPDDKLMRLIEEIQSDRHQSAAEKIYPAKGDAAEAEVLRNRLESGKVLEEGGKRDATPDELEEASLTLAEIEGSMRRRGYRGISEDLEVQELPRKLTDAKKRFQELSDQVYKLDPDLRGQKYRQLHGELNAAREETLSLENRLGVLKEMPPDAPFKDPAEYALLELKQQMLNAAKRGQDYLGLIGGEDVSERFGHTQEQAAGNAYVYDKVYRGQLEKLARQYGASVGDVPISIKTPLDIATPTMRQHELETTDDILRALRLADITDPEDLGLHFDRMNDILSEIEDKAPREARKARSSVDNLRAEMLARSSAINTNGEMWDNPDVKSWYNQLDDDLETAHDEYVKKLREEKGPMSMKEKTLRAMKLDPEVREKILKAGVPIWSLGATGVGLSMLNNEDQDPGFAEGGSVIADRLEALKRQWKEGKLSRDYLRSGVLSQLEGLNDKGEAGFENPIGWKMENGELKPYIKWRPGMVDEMMSLPTLGSYLGLDVPEWAQSAQERSDRLHAAVRSQLELEDPKNFGDSAMESLGMMMTQIPVPVKGEKVIGSTARDAREFGSKVAGSPLEFLLQTINPRQPGNYLFGTVAGGALGQLGANEPDPKITPIKKAEGGKVSSEGTAPLQRMLENLRVRYEQLTGTTLGENDAEQE